MTISSYIPALPTLTVPIIQGGMGVGVSLGNLAGAVAACGGMGVISTVNCGYREPDFKKDIRGANLRALTAEVKRALAIAKGKGVVAINAMVATTQYAESIKAAIEAGVQAIISGAGLPSTLPKIAENSGVALAPIVSSGRAAKVICRMWDKHHGVIPDFVVVEGVEAGGHLGFKKEAVLAGTTPSLDTILSDVLTELKPFEEKCGRSIPVFMAGGVYTGADMAHYTHLGATGIQMATRFIATEECDASLAFKEQIVAATQEDITIVPSPVGMPGRALNTPLIQKLAAGMTFKSKKCGRCLVPCNPAQTPYCISDALIAGVKGDVEHGLFFCGSNAWRVDKIVPVKTLMDELENDWRKNQ